MSLVVQSDQKQEDRSGLAQAESQTIVVSPYTFDPVNRCMHDGAPHAEMFLRVLADLAKGAAAVPPSLAESGPRRIENVGRTCKLITIERVARGVCEQGANCNHSIALFRRT